KAPSTVRSELSLARPPEQQLDADMGSCGRNPQVVRQAKHEKMKEKYRRDPDLVQSAQLWNKELVDKQLGSLSAAALKNSTGLGYIQRVDKGPEGLNLSLFTDAQVQLYVFHRKLGLCSVLYIDSTGKLVASLGKEPVLNTFLSVDNPASAVSGYFSGDQRPRPLRVAEVTGTQRSEGMLHGTLEAVYKAAGKLAPHDPHAPYALPCDASILPLIIVTDHDAVLMNDASMFFNNMRHKALHDRLEELLSQGKDDELDPKKPDNLRPLWICMFHWKRAVKQYPMTAAGFKELPLSERKWWSFVSTIFLAHPSHDPRFYGPDKYPAIKRYLQDTAELMRMPRLQVGKWLFTDEGETTLNPSGLYGVYVRRATPDDYASAARPCDFVAEVPMARKADGTPLRVRITNKGAELDADSACYDGEEDDAGAFSYGLSGQATEDGLEYVVNPFYSPALADYVDLCATTKVFWTPLLFPFIPALDNEFARSGTRPPRWVRTGRTNDTSEGAASLAKNIDHTTPQVPLDRYVVDSYEVITSLTSVTMNDIMLKHQSAHGNRRTMAALNKRVTAAHAAVGKHTEDVAAAEEATQARVEADLPARAAQPESGDDGLPGVVAGAVTTWQKGKRSSKTQPAPTVPARKTPAANQNKA
ncbi:hypothetical protein Agub_g505, partial [Astrephomene gubernaculifera]